MADYNSDRTGSNIDFTLDKVDALDAKVQPTATGANVTGTVTADGLMVDGSGSAESLSVSSEVALTSVNGKISWANGFISGGNSYGDMRHFGDRHRFYSEDGSKLAINFDIAGNKIEFFTSGTERARIDSSGNLLVGMTTASSTTAGMYVRPSSSSGFVGDGTNALTLGRINSDGDILQFRKDGATVGSIGTAYNALHIGSGDTGLLYSGVYDNIIPHNPSTNVVRDGAIDLGSTTSRFKDLYLSGGVYFGGTGAANKLDDYETGTWTPTFVGQSGGAATLAPSNAKYTKVGNLVTVFIEQLQWASKTTFIGNAIIGGLPFAAITGFRSATGGIGGATSGTFSFTGTPFIGIDSGVPNFWVMFKSPTNGTYTHVGEAHLGSTGLVYGVSLTYLTAS